MGEHLLQKRVMSSVEIDQIDGSSDRHSQLIDQLNAYLRGDRRGRSDGEIQIAFSMGAVGCQRAKKNSDDNRRVACQDLCDGGLNRSRFISGATGIAHICSVTTNSQSAQGYASQFEVLAVTA